MGILSNFLTHSADSAQPLEVRHIGPDDERACTKPVRRLLHNATAAGLKLDHFLGAVRPDGWIVAGLLAVPRPGRTAMVFVTPPRNDSETHALIHLATHGVQLLPQASVALVQAILQPHETAEAEALLRAGFWKLGDLAYLQLNVQKATTAPRLPLGLVLRTWSDELEPLFLQTLCDSYEQSRDCPALHDLREPRDVLAGHKGTGVFDPSLWSLVEFEGRAAGVLLLNRIPEMGCIDLVYLGICAGHRRRGLGHALMEHALWHCAQRGISRLTLAVDLHNEPALRLYAQFGAFETGRRTILMRCLSRRDGSPRVEANNFSTGFPS